jgi:thiosulfate dehydrogenase [quinone] large subunit
MAAERRVRSAGRLDRGIIAVARVGAAVLWIGGLGWKIPPRFGEGAPPDAPRDLYQWTSYAVTDPVFGPYSWLVEELVLPNFAVFGWLVLFVEAGLGAFLLIGLATRFWALVGIGQAIAIMLSVANAPEEWIWSYLLMILLHAVLFATAAGRCWGLDAVLRPRWLDSGSRPARLLAVAS